MPRTVFEILAPTHFNTQLPIEIRQKTSLAAALTMVFLLVPALAAVLIPVGLLTAHASQKPAVIAVVWTNPLIAMQLFAGLVIWVVLFLLPMKSLLSRLGRRRTVRIDDERVHVTEQYLFTTKNWSRPLASYRGIAHDVRATLSGTRHELILVHNDKRRTLLLHAAEQIPQSAIDQAANLLKLPQLQARELYFSFNRETVQVPRQVDLEAASMAPVGSA